MTDPHYLWSPRIYTLPQLLTEFRSKLPVLVEVETGHHGLDDMHTYSSEEMFLVHAIKSQKRVVCVDRYNRQFSIPRGFDVCFKVLDKNKPPDQQLGPVQSLADILDGWDQDSTLRIVMDNTANISFSVNKSNEESLYFDELEVIDIYDESYLVGNAINDGEMFLDPVLIPVYVCIEVKMAVGLDKEYCHKEHYMKWEQFLEKYHNLVKLADTSNLHFNKQIIELPDSLDLNEDPYDYIEPKNFLYLNPEELRRNLKEVEGKAPPPVPPKTYKKDGQTSPTRSISRKGSKEEPSFSSMIKKSVSFPSVAKISGAMRKVKGKFDTLRSEFGKKQNKHVKAHHALEYESTSDSEDGEAYDYIEVEGTTQKPLADISQKGISESNVPAPAIPPKPTFSIKQSQYKKDRPKGFEKTGLLAAVVKPQPAEIKPATQEGDEDEDDIYGYLAKIPKDVSTLTVTEVSNLLKNLKMDSQVQLFADHHVDGKLLVQLNEGILMEEFGCSRFKARKLMQFISGWRPTK